MENEALPIKTKIIAEEPGQEDAEEGEDEVISLNFKLHAKCSI
jgi:hypothetical protein